MPEVGAYSVASSKCSLLIGSGYARLAATFDCVYIDVLYIAKVEKFCGM